LAELEPLLFCLSFNSELYIHIQLTVILFHFIYFYFYTIFSGFYVCFYHGQLQMAFSRGRSSSLRSRTLACSNTPARQPSQPS